MVTTPVAADSVSPVPTPAIQHFTTAVNGGTLHTMSISPPSGENMAVATAFAPSGVSASQIETAITTVGAGTLTTAALLGGDILRSGPTGAFTDTTDTAALIQAAWVGSVGSSFQFVYKNTTAFAATMAGGSGVTLSGNLIVPANMWARYLAVWTGTSTITIYNIETGQLNPLPDAKFSTSSVTTGSMAAGLATGAKLCVWTQSGATPGAQLFRTAAQLLADQPNGRVGMSWVFRIINTGAGALTPTADGGGTVTITGGAAIAQNTWSDYMMTINTATTATAQYIGNGVVV
jgi:hypothetical protein